MSGRESERFVEELSSESSEEEPESPLTAPSSVPEIPWSKRKFECAQCKQWVSKPHAARHRKSCKDKPKPLTKEELVKKRRGYNRKSYQKYQTQRLRNARLGNARRMYQTMLNMKEAVQTAENRYEELLRGPPPEGLHEKHPLHAISLCPDFFEFLLSKLDAYELLSRRWFISSYRYLHSDKLSTLPPQYQDTYVRSKIVESCKHIGNFMQLCIDREVRASFVESIEEYREYLRYEYPEQLRLTQLDVEHELSSLDETIATLKKQLGRYFMFSGCNSLQSFQEVYLTRFEARESADDITDTSHSPR